MTGNYNLLFINCIQGANGFRLGRVLSCYEHVYWYAHTDNGMTPWEFTTDPESTVYEANFAECHFDRLLENDHMGDRVYIPMVGSKIEKYWDNDEWINRWYEIMSNRIIPEPDKYLPFIVHDSPSYLRKIFPNCYIFNLISDPVVATKWHFQTSSNYRIDYTFEGQRPDYKSKWVQQIEEMLAINPKATQKDLWMHTNNGTEQEYENYVYRIQEENNQRNLAEASAADITTTWADFDILALQTVFGKIHENYKLLIPDSLKVKI